MTRDETILSAIRDLTAELGWPPTVRELAQRVGFNSPGTMHERLTGLEARGLIARGHGQPRALRVIA